MAVRLAKSPAIPRSEQVRRRRQQKTKRRYDASGIAGQHIFWVDAAEVQRKVAAVPGIASAVVRIDWPATVTIQVVERVPVVSWNEGSQKSWADADGNKFAARTDLPGLLPI